MNSKKSLIEELRNGGKAFLEEYTGLEGEWTRSSDKEIELTIKKKTENGFDVVLYADKREAIVFGQGAHIHMERCNDPHEVASYALGLTYDLLSKRMRIIEYTVSGRPYKWKMQTFIDGKWRTNTIIRLFVWTMFRNKKQRIYQNGQLSVWGKMVEQGVEGDAVDRAP